MNSHRKSAPAIAIYPGSFDPITLGHLDIIERASRLFDRVIVVVSRNLDKAPLFSVEQRVAQIRQCTQHLLQVEVDSFTGLTVDCARQRGASVLIRGLRVLSDFEKELQMAHTNKSLWSGIETVFLATATEHSFLSSSAVKEIARFGGKIDHLTPPNVALDLYSTYQCHEKTSLPPQPQPKPSTSPPSPTTTSTCNENSTKSND